MARIPDGVFNAVGDTLELISGPERTYSDVQRLASALTRARTEGLSPSEAAARVRAEVPELGSLADLLPKTRNELYAFISMLLAALAIILAARPSGTEVTQVIQNINIEQIINQSVTNINVVNGPSSMETVSEGTKKPGRNDMCPCGSGRKFKKCHLSK